MSGCILFCLRGCHFLLRRRVGIATIAALSLVICASTAMAASPPQDKALAGALQKDLQDSPPAPPAIDHISTLSITITFRGNPYPINLATGTTQYGAGQPVTT